MKKLCDSSSIHSHTREWRKPILWILFFCYVAVIILFASHHEPWGDEFHVWWLASTLNLGELWDVMRTEGHFCLWHLLIYPFARCGIDYRALYVVSCTLMTAAAWLLVFKSPFNLLTRVLLLAYYPVLYYFPVVSRCYALIPPILFALAILYRQLPRHKYLYCFLLGLLAHTHAYMEGLVGALFCLYIYDYIISRWANGWQAVRPFLWPTFITVGFVVLAYAQVSGSMQQAEALNATQDLSNARSLIKRGLLIFTVLCFVFFLMRDPHRRKMGWVLLFAVGWQVFFALHIYYMDLQRTYLPILSLIFVMWCVYDARYSRLWTYALVFVSLLDLVRIYQAYQDIDRPYSDCRQGVAFVRETLPPGSTVFYWANEYFSYSLSDQYQVSAYSLEDLETMLRSGSSASLDFYYILKGYEPLALKIPGWNISLIHDKDCNGAIYEGHYIYHIHRDPLQPL